MQSANKPTFVTTSWDDGDLIDLRLADLLRRAGIPATFYIPIKYRELPLSPADLRALSSEGFEIGAHGCTHKLLRSLSPQEVAEEVKPCKKILEDILGRQVGMFCYPAGRYDTNTIRILEEAGYRGARTVRMLATDGSFEPFIMPTTLQVYPHAPLTYFKNTARAHSLESLKSCVTQLPKLGNWVDLGKSLFDRVLNQGGIWHLYGHSWEIEKLGLWDGLCELLDYVSHREGVRYVPNSGLLERKTGESFCHGELQTNYGSVLSACEPISKSSRSRALRS